MASAAFGAACGSTIVNAAVFTKMAMPEMTRFGYDKRLSAGCIAASGTLASLIPPSILMIVYAVITEQLVGRLLIAGLVAGLLSALVFMVGTIEGLARALGLPAARLAATLAAIAHDRPDGSGRRFPPIPLAPPYCGVRVTGALFHTQGGLCVNENAPVLRADNSPFGNLHAGGGAACGVSGKSDSGYLSGNGLLSAVVLGRIAGSAPCQDRTRIICGS